MKTLAHNKILLGVLLGLMQFSMAIRVAPCAVSTWLGVGACRCCETSPAGVDEGARTDGCCGDSDRFTAPEARSCCARSQSLEPTGDGVDSRGSRVDRSAPSCACAGPSEVPVSEGRECRQQKPGGRADSVAAVPCPPAEVEERSVRASRLERTSAHEQRAGPPLHVLYRVFLI